MKIIRSLTIFVVLVSLVAGCAVQECFIKPDPKEPVLVRITKGKDGVPKVTPKMVVLLPDQEVIFMSKSVFNLDFIGMSPIDLSVRGQKHFKSKDGDVIFRSTGKLDNKDGVNFDAYLEEVVKDGTLERLGMTIEELKNKLPKFGDKYVELQYTIEIDGVVLDPPFRRIIEH